LKISLFFLVIVFLISPLAAEEHPHQNLSWLGFLHLPQKEVQVSNIFEVEKPRLWSEWEQQEDKGVLSWLPSPSGNQVPASKYLLNFQPIPKVEKSRRERHQP
jgi:hypothetical protein